MQDNPLISVCVLCYNHEKYVAQAIESVINQTYKNIELVIVDNASTDKSCAIITRYTKLDERIKFYSLKDNTFPSYGINYAIQRSNGEYVAILSADDYFELDKIERQLKYIQQENIDVCFTWAKVVNDLGDELIEHFFNKLFNRDFDKQDLKFIMIDQNTLCATTCMLKKSIFEDVGYFDHRLLQLQDLDLWLRIIKKYPIKVMQEKLTCYRIRGDDNNLSNDSNKKVKVRTLTEWIWVMQNICEFDATIISQALDKQCDNESKYKALFDYYCLIGNKAYATAVLLAVYNKLGANFSFPSGLYRDFFEMYSSFDMFDNFGFVAAAVSELFIATPEQPNFNCENSLTQPISLSNQYFYSLDKYSKITQLRLDPINQPAKVKLLAAYVKLNNGENYPLELAWHNADLNADVYEFKHIDPQMVFNIPEVLQNNLAAVQFEIDITPYSKSELCMLLSNV